MGYKRDTHKRSKEAPWQKQRHKQTALQTMWIFCLLANLGGTKEKPMESTPHNQNRVKNLSCCPTHVQERMLSPTWGARQWYGKGGKNEDAERHTLADILPSTERLFLS